MKQRDDEIKKSSTQEVAIDPNEIANDAMSMAGRLLAEKSIVKKIEDKMGEPIFKKTGGDISFEVYSSVFAESGFNPLEAADKTSINKTSYKNFDTKYKQILM